MENTIEQDYILGKPLTAAQLNALERLTKDEDIVWADGVFYIGDDRTNGTLVNKLLAHSCIIQNSYCEDNYKLFHITKTGRVALEKRCWLTHKKLVKHAKRKKI